MAFTNFALFGGAFFTPVIVGKMTETMFWRWPFYFVAIFAAIFAPLVSFKNEYLESYRNHSSDINFFLFLLGIRYFYSSPRRLIDGKWILTQYPPTTSSYVLQLIRTSMIPNRVRIGQITNRHLPLSESEIPS
jgi:MFS family permease